MLSSPLLSSVTSPFIFSPLPLPLCYSLSFPSLSSALSTFLLYSSPLSSPLFVSPLFSSPVLSSPRPSVYPIWPSHLSWELSQGTRLLIQFLLNLMALSSAFAIPATCRETKQKKKNERDREAQKPVWIPPKNCPWMTKINSEAAFQNVTAIFLPAPLLSGGRTKYMYKVTLHFTLDRFLTTCHL